jgi:hypothetical protein
VVISLRDVKGDNAHRASIRRQLYETAMTRKHSLIRSRIQFCHCERVCYRC